MMDSMPIMIVANLIPKKSRAFLLRTERKDLALERNISEVVL